MNAIVQFVLKHGYSVPLAAMFVHQIGLPVPGPLARADCLAGDKRWRQLFGSGACTVTK
jgi:hypothetical protein